MKTYLLIISITFFTHLASGQWLKGQIVELDTGIPIPYARLGVLHKNKGVVSDSSGYFRMDLTNLSENDTVIISAIGYEKIEFIVSHCRIYLLQHANLRLELSPKSKLHQEVVVEIGKSKILETGNNVKSTLYIAGFQNKSLGAEMGTVLKYNKKKKGIIIKLHFNIVGNPTDTVKFRTNIYTFENDLPGKSILNHPIYYCGIPSKGAIEIDVSGWNISVKNDCFVSIELIENIGMDGLFFKSAFLRSKSYIRDAPEGVWNKAMIDLGFWAEIKFYR
ncbi:MAG: carboxypeptidase-like regulatory domain-containing protein [Crocinitomicaceae bacterium]